MTTASASLTDLLHLHAACDDGFNWAKQYATPAEAWDACPRPDWMLWGLDEMGIRDDAKLRLWACWCVRYTPLGDGRTTWDLLPDPCLRTAVEVAERFARGEATADQRNDACAAADRAAQSYAAARRIALSYSGSPLYNSASAAACAAARSAHHDVDVFAESASSYCANAVMTYTGRTQVDLRGDFKALAWQAQADALRQILGNPFVTAP
jgi:hypothetical protein